MNGFENIPKPVEEEKPKTLVEKASSLVQSKVNECRLPTKEILGYESSVGVYGGKINYDKEGEMVFDMRGLISKIDQKGDPILRAYDDHTVKNPIEMFKKHPKWFFKFLFAGTKRYRGTPEEISESIKRLGLEEEYELHKWGIKINDPELFKSGRPLQDIYRSDIIEDNDLEEVDRFQALAQATEYISKVHSQNGAIGEVLPSDILFKNKENNSVDQPVLNIPDIVYNSKKETSENDKKTTDLLDFTMSIGIEELRRSEDWNEVQRAIRTILDSYNDPQKVILLKSFAKRGRLTMQGDTEGLKLSKVAKFFRPLTAVHNKARVNFDKDTTSNLRKLIIDECDSYLESNK